jgi:hypothetical protein
VLMGRGGSATRPGIVRLLARTTRTPQTESQPARDESACAAPHSTLCWFDTQPKTVWPILTRWSRRKAALLGGVAGPQRPVQTQQRLYRR